ncbi:MAG TPA: YoaK family protein [Candidatus Baltobacteraceae bacterium]|jgi:uncharacterized membrane protein YoaK (UPF0700 family)|nr:YoaK family protein [Candidatus Baltobacteraceae bacterium]
MTQNHGPLPGILALLTLVTGFVDAVTYLKFGHVFVANMTGNIVFLGFGLAGAPGISVPGSLLALAAFLLGALIGGLFIRRYGDHHGHLLAYSSLFKVALLLMATIIAAVGLSPLAVIPELGITMGIQNAVARKIAIPDLTTTVLTMTLTGIMADSSLVGGSNPRLVRRILAVLTMFAGAFAGAALVLNRGIVPALGAAALIMALVSTSAWLLGRGNPAWVHAT